MSWRVRDVMTYEVVSVLPDTPFKQCVEMVRAHRVGALPVLDSSGRLLGILTESDLLSQEVARPDDSRRSARLADEAMTRALVTVDPGVTLAEAARLMHSALVRHLLVIDGGGRLVGIVARADLLKVVLRSAESIRREVEDELLPRTFGIPHGSLEIEVRDGVVKIGGEVETESLARLVLAFVERVEGVVAVEGTLSHRSDDTPAHLPLAVS